ncbi:MAG: DUF302 domain-containing protein [Sulfurimonadaceae bacterium]|nr:DUF302 domain-containing protein [Sulfurimonadaceae bacterium]
MKKLLLLLACALSLYSSELIIKESKYGVSQTIQNIKEIVTSQGFGVFAIIDHRANAGLVGMEMREAKVIVFGNPKAGTKLMQEDILSALDLPLRVLVYRDSPQSVKVVYRNVSTLEKDFNLKDTNHLTTMDKGLEAIVKKATE